MNAFEEKLTCVMKTFGADVGDVLRCLIQSEISAQLSRIQQLQGVLNGTICIEDATPPA
jgi:hypothetical protein